MCDVDGRGTLDAYQVRNIVQRSAAVAEATREQAGDVLKALLKGGTSVTASQFQKVVEEHPSLLACFSMVFGVNPDKVPTEKAREYVSSRPHESAGMNC